MAIPLSQIPSRVLDDQLASVPLEKFSFAVTTLGTGNHQWVHDNRADKLFLVFRQTRQSQCGDAVDNPLLMSVTAGSQILVRLSAVLLDDILIGSQERQDLRKLKAMVVDFELQCQQRHVDHALEPPVHVMIKFPCIALRYLTSATLVSSVVR